MNEVSHLRNLDSLREIWSRRLTVFVQSTLLPGQSLAEIHERLNAARDCLAQARLMEGHPDANQNQIDSTEKWIRYFEKMIALYEFDLEQLEEKGEIDKNAQTRQRLREEIRRILDYDEDDGIGKTYWRAAA